MPFFSDSGGGRSGTLLQTTCKPKAHHHLRSKFSLSAPTSSRRRGGLHSASSPYSRRALCLAATAFAALFILAFVRLGFPSSRSAALSSPARPRARLTRRPAFRLRDPVAAAFAARIGREAPVDITTRDLYDRIEFSDEDGGAWKQGWEVKYRTSTALPV